MNTIAFPRSKRARADSTSVVSTGAVHRPEIVKPGSTPPATLTPWCRTLFAQLKRFLRRTGTGLVYLGLLILIIELMPLIDWSGLSQELSFYGPSKRRH